MASTSAEAAYVRAAMVYAVIEPMGDGEFVGRVPGLTGAIAFGPTEGGTREELRSVLEEWVSLGIELGHHIPPVDGVDLNSPREGELRQLG